MTDDEAGSEESAAAEASGAELLDHLGDDVSRSILACCAAAARSVGELAEQCDVSEATIYRRLNRLLDAGLLDEDTRIDATAVSGGKEYTTAVERVEVTLGDDGVDVVASERRGDDDVPTFTVVESDDEEREPVVDLQLRLPESLFSEFLAAWAELNRRAGGEVDPAIDGERLVDSLNAN
jgi:DNA-binding Lrp family transcriptional regulator